jgi:biopolymer transport protein ExbB
MPAPLLANIIVDLFLKGGPVMYPILLAALVAIAVIGERIFWWTRLARRRNPAQLEKIFAAMENADFPAASALAKESNDPVVRMIYHGLNHHHSSLQGALQVAAGLELQQAGRFLPALDTLVTLAPLLGLLGTVTGIMGSFTSIGTEELAVTRVTGGIGEALIATACGLGIAIITLIPFNYFNARVARLQFELEAAATNVEVMINNAKQQGLSTDTERVARGLNAPERI